MCDASIELKTIVIENMVRKKVNNKTKNSWVDVAFISLIFKNKKQKPK